MLVTRFLPVAGAFAAFFIAVAVRQDRTLVAHDFTSSTEGWVISGDTGPARPELRSTGGQPGGYIAYVDEAVGETWYFRAPDIVLKQLASAANGTLSYSLKQSSDEPGFLDDDVVIVGPAGRLSYRFGRTPTREWTSFTLPLWPDGWRWNWNAPATPEQFTSVLANPTRLEIRGEYYTGDDEGGLDNVVLKAAD